MNSESVIEDKNTDQTNDTCELQIVHKVSTVFRRKLIDIFKNRLEESKQELLALPPSPDGLVHDWWVGECLGLDFQNPDDRILYRMVRLGMIKGRVIHRDLYIDPQSVLCFLSGDPAIRFVEGDISANSKESDGTPEKWGTTAGIRSELCNPKLLVRLAGIDRREIKRRVKDVITVQRKAGNEAPFVRISEAAQLMGLLEDDVHALVKLKALRSYHKGGKHLISLWDISQFVGGPKQANELQAD